jgi:hypothetical protein
MDGDSNLREDSISGYRIYYVYLTSALEDTLSRSPRVLRDGATVIEVLPLSVGPMGSRLSRGAHHPTSARFVVPRSLRELATDCDFSQPSSSILVSTFGFQTPFLAFHLLASRPLEQPYARSCSPISRSNRLLVNYSFLRTKQLLHSQSIARSIQS